MKVFSKIPRRITEVPLHSYPVDTFFPIILCRLSKTDKSEVYLLWKAYELSLIKGNTHKYFKELTVVDVELRPLLMRGQMIYRSLQRMREAGVDVLSDIKEYEGQLKIVEKATKIIPRLEEVAEALGLDRDDVNGLIELVRLLTYLRFRLGFTSINKSINYLGIHLEKGRQSNVKKCNRKAAKYSNPLTSDIFYQRIIKDAKQR